MSINCCWTKAWTIVLGSSRRIPPGSVQRPGKGKPQGWDMAGKGSWDRPCSGLLRAVLVLRYMPGSAACHCAIFSQMWAGWSQRLGPKTWMRACWACGLPEAGKGCLGSSQGESHPHRPQEPRMESPSVVRVHVYQHDEHFLTSSF